MRRYIINAKPRANFEDLYVDAESSLARTVYEPDQSPIDTGLLDAHGAPIYAIHEPRPIGFRAEFE